MRKRVRRLFIFISCSGHPWVVRNLPAELVQEIRPSLNNIKERCNEWLENRGVFKK